MQNKPILLKDNPIKYNEGYLYTYLEKYNFKRNDDFEKYKNILTINLDWLQLLCEFENGTNLPIIIEGQTDYVITESLILRYSGYGTSMFFAHYELILDGEEVGTIQTQPRLIRGSMKENSFMLQLKNHILYNETWLQTLSEILVQLEAEVHNISRMDIAIDGANHIPEFLNFYVRQNPKDKIVHQKGKANFNCFQHKRDKFEFERFQFGSNKSDKQISIYCKSREIETSNKKYIENFWRKSGMMTDNEVWRVEMRMKSKAISEIKDFDITCLDEVGYLASIFRTQSVNFFQFIFLDGTDTNVSRKQIIELIDYDKLQAKLLEKTEIKPVNDRYKAKLALHLSAKLILMNKVEEQFIMSHLDTMFDNMRRYDLGEWYNKKKIEWIELYTQFGEVKNLELLNEPECEFETEL